MQSNLQVGIDQQREVYGHLRFPLLQQLCRIHSLTVRDVATIFGIGKSHAQEIITHQKAPSLELAFRLARYFEVTVDELFGWRFDDSGERRPLVIELSNKVLVKLAVGAEERSGDGTGKGCGGRPEDAQGAGEEDGGGECRKLNSSRTAKQSRRVRCADS